MLGAENQDTFNPVSYSHCPVIHNGGCQVMTEGCLSNSGADVNWGSLVPLGQPFNCASGSSPTASQIIRSRTRNEKHRHGDHTGA